MTYGCILADPPWRFTTYDRKKAVAGRAADPYPTMSLEELMALPVPDLADRDCVLILWVVDSHLDQALRLGAAWDFTYKTVAFIWDKGRMGMGFWTRKEAEIALLFTRGRPKRLSGGVRQIIREPRREHSRKPEGQYQRIASLTGGPYLELFARQEREGWASWGNETTKFNHP